MLRLLATYEEGSGPKGRGPRRSGHSERYNLSQNRYFFLASRKSGDSARVKRRTSSPVTVLMSWCRLRTLMPVTSCTIASSTGRAVSTRWVRTCLSKSLPFSAGERLDQVLFGGGQNALKADHEEITEQVGVNALGTPAHVVLLKATDSFTNSGFEFSPCSHGGTHHPPLSEEYLSESPHTSAEQEPSPRTLPPKYRWMQVVI